MHNRLIFRYRRADVNPNPRGTKGLPSGELTNLGAGSEGGTQEGR